MLAYLMEAYVHIIITLNSTVCILLLLCLSFFLHPSHSHAPPTHPFIYAGPILVNSMKESPRTGKNQPFFTCQVSCTKSFDNRKLSIIMLSERVQYQWLFNWISKMRPGLQKLSMWVQVILIYIFANIFCSECTIPFP